MIWSISHRFRNNLPGSLPGFLRRRPLAIAVRFLFVVALGALLYLGIYRPIQLDWGATDAELASSLPGDEIASEPVFNATRAVTIAAPPEEVWPWVVQIGYKRAGWYSALDWLDNDGIPSATRIVPELQDLKVGDTMPIWEGVEQTVLAIEPNRYLLTVSDREHPDTWLWYLEPTSEGGTRLIWRMRNGTYDWASPFLVAQLATDLGDFVIVRNALLSIKERAEGRPIESRAATTPQVLLWIVVFLTFLVSLASLIVRRDWLRPLGAVAVTYVVTLLLVFNMPPLWVDALATFAVIAALWWLYRGYGQARQSRPQRSGVPLVPAAR
jgi:hypothetical protein